MHPKHFLLLLLTIIGVAIPPTATILAADIRPLVSVTDTLAFREIIEQCISPSGDRVAFVTRVADLGKKQNVETLALVDATTGSARNLAISTEITHLYWDQTGHAIYALCAESGRQVLRRFDSTTAVGEEIWHSDTKVDQLAISPDGTCCVVSRLVFSPPALAESRIDSGLVYEYRHHDSETLTDRLYDEVEAAEFLVIDTVKRTERVVARTPFIGFRPFLVTYPYAADISIAPDNRRVAIRLICSGQSKEGPPVILHRIRILDLVTGDWNERMPDTNSGQMGAVWLGDSDRLFFVTKETGRIYSNGVGNIFDVRTGATTELPWAQSSSSWIVSSRYDKKSGEIYLQLRDALIRVSPQTRKTDRVAEIRSAPSFDANFAKYAFVSEASELRPEIAVCDLKTGATRRLTNLNPYLEEHALGKIEKLTVTNAYGTDTTAYLVYPVNYEPREKYPLVLASYGFLGHFILTAEWHTTFPAQALAGQGYAVLLVNTPSITGMDVLGDVRMAQEREGWQVLSSFETAIQMLVQRGLADPARLGLYGWSHGGFIVEFLLAHSKLPFKAACVGEGGDYNPSGYWLWGGKSPWPKIYQNMFGGPFTAKTAAAYLEFSPVLRVDHVNTPLLLEFVTQRGILGLEFLVPLKERGVPAEMVLYDNEQHNFTRPTVRLASMNRKIDWPIIGCLKKRPRIRPRLIRMPVGAKCAPCGKRLRPPTTRRIVESSDWPGTQPLFFNARKTD